MSRRTGTTPRLPLGLPELEGLGLDPSAEASPRTGSPVRKPLLSEAAEPMPEVYMPYPEIVERRAHAKPYAVLDTRGRRDLPSNGMVSKQRREILVPLGPGGLVVSRHELAHVKWSPTRVRALNNDPRVLMAVEDARINLGLEWLGIPMELSATECANVGYLAAKDLERGDLGAFLLRATASLGTNAHDAILDVARDLPSRAAAIVEGLLGRVQAQLVAGRERRGGPVASFAAVRRIARKLERRLFALGVLEPLSPDAPPERGCCGWGEAVDGPDDEDGRVLERYLGAPGRRVTVRESGRMTVTEAPLTVALDPPRRGALRDWKPSTEGSVVRWIHRYPIDGAIFRRGRRKPGGTVLVDTSGSMSFDTEAIERIVSAAPGATLVAIYSGRDREGQLRIVARNGRRAAGRHLKSFAGGNVVDVPALEWLAAQPGPRIWLSDGVVTGVGDAASPEIKRRCRQLCRQGRVRRVESSEDAFRLLAGKPVRELSPTSRSHRVRRSRRRDAV